MPSSCFYVVSLLFVHCSYIVSVMFLHRFCIVSTLSHEMVMQDSHGAFVLFAHRCPRGELNRGQKRPA